jgi:hypothetical protein
MSWSEAESNCAQWNAHLASITDKFEQSWLTQIQASQELKWIGLKGASGTSNYQWLNNETFSYSNWDKNKPG